MAVRRSMIKAPLDYAPADVRARHRLVPGWFDDVDAAVFRWILDWQSAHGVRGDLAELGVFQGKSAIVIGWHVCGSETFTVAELFGAPAGDAATESEVRTSYPGLDRSTFEDTYLLFHDRLPEVVEGPTTLLEGRLGSASHRFVHVDASHLYHHVVADLRLSERILRSGGVVACDDYRSEHTPGVAAAVWAEVAAGALVPLCLTPQKLYATTGPAQGLADDLAEWLSRHDHLEMETHGTPAGPVIRIVQGMVEESPVRSLVRGWAPPRALTEALRLRDRMTVKRWGTASHRRADSAVS